ncbi:daunorubicin resistance protein DrrA family ABC transporter ATP-binding protein [Halarchaeum grantii]|uniref:Daunorubicin resistance protein DrrA family ABC transporter ATP-binding protein n=1 Tax=Halarchaeum grantii TaxID=1193105 RepID=A0A830F230_9EURY|nr:ATP-binding cassette domain-containing protein [Halarchaeum grantii]GGL33157.1 daunorubicin resistance protein DrrA family ABC transporter ATP-binding protein [Halarchaeum grantii]
MSAIHAEHLAVTYADGTEAVTDVTLDVPDGEFFGFLGANGAGKTTTIKTLVTLLNPTEGRVAVNDYDVADSPREVRESIGYMAQETSIDRELTARENVRYACEAYGVPREEREARIDDLLDLVDLADVADKPAKGFSGGMQKRLDVATALVHEPPVVFLDEPTTGLDPKARNRLWDYFERINDRGTTVFLTTQYLEEADHLCERIGVIVDGEIAVTGSPAELKAEVGGDVLEVDLDDPSDAEVERAREVAVDSRLAADADAVEATDEGVRVTSSVARRHGTDLLVALRDAGLTITGFNVRSPTLDDVFLSVTGEAYDPESEEADGAEPTGVTR